MFAILNFEENMTGIEETNSSEKAFLLIYMK
jgi:hypothetical protein